MKSSPRIIEVKCSRALSRSNLPEMDYSLNPYHGCLHGCIYCFAMDFTPEYDAVEEWGSKIYVRTNIAEKLRHEISGLKRGTVGISTITDPYQSIEGRYRLTRKCLSILLENGFYVTLQTKSPLVIRDIDVIDSHRENVDVGMTLTTLSSDLATILEPGSPSPASRISSIERLSHAGVRTWIYLGPIIKGVNDSMDDIEEIVGVCERTGSRLIFDRYASYRHSDIMISSAAESSGLRADLKTTEEWWMDLSRNIQRIGKDHGVVTVTQDEDWKLEKKLRIRTLEKF